MAYSGQPMPNTSEASKKLVMSGRSTACSRRSCQPVPTNASRQMVSAITRTRRRVVSAGSIDQPRLSAANSSRPTNHGFRLAKTRWAKAVRHKTKALLVPSTSIHKKWVSGLPLPCTALVSVTVAVRRA